MKHEGRVRIVLMTAFCAVCGVAGPQWVNSMGGSSKATVIKSTAAVVPEMNQVGALLPVSFTEVDSTLETDSVAEVENLNRHVFEPFLAGISRQTNESRLENEPSELDNHN